MDLRPEDFIGVETDEQKLVDISTRLGELSEETRFSLVKPLLLHKSHRVQNVGLQLVKSSISTEDYLSKILEISLDVADASRIRWWLEFLVPKLGHRQVFSVIRDNLEKNPAGADKALYWLPWIMSPDNPELVSEFKKLMEEAKRLGVIRQPIIVPVYRDEK